MADYPDVPTLLHRTTIALTQLQQALQTATDILADLDPDGPVRATGPMILDLLLLPEKSCTISSIIILEV